MSVYTRGMSQSSDIHGVSRRAVLRAIPALAALPLAACTRDGDSREHRVVVYCSADDVYARPIFEQFERGTGIKIEALFDTEATKTTGLVQRLIDEKGSPRCDVWWSSEPFGTIRLADEGVLDPYDSGWAQKQAGQAGLPQWPAALRGEGSGGWYGFATRARVFVVNTKYVEVSQRPGCLADLCRPVFKGRVGMARPQFGTTRGHIAAVAAEYGEQGLREWLTRLKANDMRLLDGNGAVVRAVSTGDLHVGLADTDDVYAGQREGWSVERVYEGKAASAFDDAPKTAAARGMGTVELPNTVALVKRAGRRNEVAAQHLIDYLISPAAQLALAKSESRNKPIAVRKEEIVAAGLDPATFEIPTPASVDLHKTAKMMATAMKIVDEVFGGI